MIKQTEEFNLRKYIVENDGKEYWVSRTDVAEPKNAYPKLATFIIK